ncbi:MAG: hypothetical protein PUB21_04690 [Bacteroidales bacterium]|nr:hypothetical protein [Bacteroidales bacterium]
MKKSLLMAIVLIASFDLSAQIHQSSTGQVVIGPTYANGAYLDTTGLVPLQILGRYTGVRTGRDMPSIAFGQQSGGKLTNYIGGESTMQMYGYSSITLGAGTGSGKVSLLTYSTQNPYKTMYIGAPITWIPVIQCQKITQQSAPNTTMPAQARVNGVQPAVSALTGALTGLCSLQAVTYNTSTLPQNASFEEASDETSEEPGTFSAEMQDNAVQASLSEPENTGRQIGFVGEEFRQIFPDLVSSDRDGNLYIDYMSLIPIMVESLKEQQNTIAGLRAEIEQIKKELTNATSK